MAEKERKNSQVAAPAAHDQSGGDTVYTVQELAQAHDQQFGTSYEMVRAALLYAGKISATLSEARELVEQFRKQEVK